MSTPAEYAADILAEHYAAVRAALEAARTTETADGPNRYAKALEALDGAVFGLSAIPALCGHCGAEIVPVDEDESRWRHAPQPDPVTDFLNHDHDAQPGEGDPPVTAPRVTAAEMAKLRAQFDAMADSAERIRETMAATWSMVAVLKAAWEDGFEKGQETPRPAPSRHHGAASRGLHLATYNPGRK